MTSWAITATRPAQFAKAIWPWLFGIAVIVAIATRVPVSAFQDGLQHGPHLLLAAVNILILATVLCSDSLSTWIGLNMLSIRRPFAHVMLARGATYTLIILNYAVGQGGLGFYLRQNGVSALRATGAVLFLMGTNLATLLIFTTIAWLVYGNVAHIEAIGWILAVGNAGLGVYLIVVAISPTFLARNQILAPLFEARLRGYAVAMLSRLPHAAVVVLGQWLALRAWGISVPFAVAVTTMPAVVIAAALPIAPAGLGTTQAALVFLFSTYASGVTAADRAGSVLAFGVVHFVYGVLATLLVGFVCAWFARRRRLFSRHQRH